MISKRLVLGHAFLALFVVATAIVLHRSPEVKAVACSASAAAQNGIKVTPSHGQAFYIDTGTTPKLDAGYIGYRVHNDTGNTQNNYWMELSNFTGGVLQLSNAADSAMKIPDMATNATATTYFLLKATAATTASQAHTVKIYDRRPDLSGATLLYQCDYAFSKVQETIKAASNKLINNGLTSSAAIEVSDTTPELGQLVTISVEGETGQIGAGSAPDNDIVWLTPAALSSWPTRALRLESVSVTFDGNKNWANTGDQVSYSDQLLINNVDGTNVDSSAYRAYYTFRVIGVPASTVSIVPVAQISSGTQVKHTDTTAAAATASLSFSALAINVNVTKTITATSSLPVVNCTGVCSVPGGTSGTTYVAVPYEILASATSVTPITIDEFIDIPDSELIYKPSSAFITDYTRVATTTPDPVFLSAESLLDPKPYHFMGPFQLSSASSAALQYQMWVPVGTYANLAYGKLGDVLIGANASSMSVVTVTSDGSGNITFVTSTQGFDVVAITDPATNVATSSATLNGNIDANGVTPLSAYFEYSTSPTLVGTTTVLATTPTGGTLSGLVSPTSTAVTITGLSSGTTYYYRVYAGNAYGSILSFTTEAVLAPPSVTTTAATNVSLTSSTLNGVINPNLTPITAIQFVYGLSPTLASGNTTSTIDDGTATALTISGSSAQSFSTNVTGLTAGNTYYYQINACTVTTTGVFPSITCPTYVSGGIQSFVASTAPSATTTAATTIGASSAQLNGTVNANYATTGIEFIYATNPTLTSGTSSLFVGLLAGGSSSSVNMTLTGLTPNTTYYYYVNATNTNGVASGTIMNFTTLASSRTLTINPGSFVSSYDFLDAPPTITATPSAGTGTISFTSLSPSVCTIDTNTGLVTFVSAGTCEIESYITAYGPDSDATSPSISFTITPASRTLSIDALSYNPTYTVSSTPPTLTSTPSAGTGTLSYTSLTPLVCDVFSLSGVVSFVTTGTCQIYSVISAYGGYGIATSTAITITILPEPQLPTVQTNAATSVSTTSATLNGEILSTGDSTTTVIGFEYGLTTSYGSTVTGTWMFSTGVFNLSVSGLSPGTTYHYRALAENGVGIGYGGDMTFTTALLSRTIEIDPASYLSTYPQSAAAPLLLSIVSAGVGTKTYSSATPLVCTVDSSTGQVTFVSVGTCTISVTIGADGTYETATSLAISFAITQNTSTTTTTGGGGSSSASSGSSSGSSLLQGNTIGQFVDQQQNEPITHADGCKLDCGAYGWFLTITNPDGSERRSDSNFAITRVLKDGRTLVQFEDKGKDFDYNDVWVIVDDRTCGTWNVVYQQKNAAWSHKVSISITYFGKILETRTLWSSDKVNIIGQMNEVSPTASPNACIVPPVLSCDRLTLVPAIVNPDGTERIAGTRYALGSDIATGIRGYGFEDKGDDFDYNDVLMTVDMNQCRSIRVTADAGSARWSHQLYVYLLIDGMPVTRQLLWANSQTAKGESVLFNGASIVESLLYGEPKNTSCRVSEKVQGLRSGDRGVAVKELQDYLDCRGLWPQGVEKNSYYGPTTERTVQDYQASQKLEPTGSIGPKTYEQMTKNPQV